MAADVEDPQGLGAHVWLLVSAVLVEAMGGLSKWPCAGVWNLALALVGYVPMASHGHSSPRTTAVSISHQPADLISSTLDPSPPR